MPMSLYLHLQNLPLLASSLDIRKFFLGLDIVPGGVQILGGEQGDAFISFNGEDQLFKALSFDKQPLLGQPVQLSLAKKHDVEKVVTKILQEGQSSSGSSKNTLTHQSHTGLRSVISAAVSPTIEHGMAVSPTRELSRELKRGRISEMSDSIIELKRRMISESTSTNELKRKVSESTIRLSTPNSDERASVRIQNIRESAYREEQNLHSQEITGHTDSNIGNRGNPRKEVGAWVDGNGEKKESAVEWNMSRHRDNSDVIHSNRGIDRETYSRETHVDINQVLQERTIHSDSPMASDRQVLLGQLVELYLAKKRDMEAVMTQILQEGQSSSSSKHTLVNQSHTGIPPVMSAAVSPSKKHGLAGSPTKELNREYNVSDLERDSTIELKRRSSCESTSISELKIRRIRESINRLPIPSSDERASVRMHKIKESGYGEERNLHSQQKTDLTHSHMGSITENLRKQVGVWTDGKGDKDESGDESSMSQHRGNRGVDRELYRRETYGDIDLVQKEHPIHNDSPMASDRQGILGRLVQLYHAQKHDVAKAMTKSLPEGQSSYSVSKNIQPNQSHTGLPLVIAAGVSPTKEHGLARSATIELNRQYNVRDLESDSTNELKRRRMSECANRLLIPSSDEKPSIRMYNKSESADGEGQKLHSQDKTGYTDGNMGSISDDSRRGLGAWIGGKGDKKEPPVEWSMSQHRGNSDIIYSNRGVDSETYWRETSVDIDQAWQEHPIHSNSPIASDTGDERHDTRRDRARSPSPEPGYVQASNLPITTTAADLREFFSGYVIAKGGITMKASPVDPDTLIAYVKFVNMKDAIRTDHICNGLKLHGKIISVSLISEIQLGCALSSVPEPDLVQPSQPTSAPSQHLSPYKQPPALYPPRYNPQVPQNYPLSSLSHPQDSCDSSIQMQNTQPQLSQPKRQSTPSHPWDSSNPSIQVQNTQPQLSQPKKQSPLPIPPAHLNSRHKIHPMFNPDDIVNMVYIEIFKPQTLKKKNGATRLWSMVGGPSKCSGVIVTHKQCKSRGLEEAILAFTTISARDEVMSSPDLVTLRAKRSVCNGQEMLTRLKEIVLLNKDIFLATDKSKFALDLPISSVEIALLQPNIKTQIKLTKNDLPLSEMEVKKKAVYLRLVKLREDITACEIWGWFDDVNGPSSGVKLVRKKDGPALYAFVTIIDVGILQGSYLEDRLGLDSYKFIGKKSMRRVLSKLNSGHEVMESTDSEKGKIMNIH